MSSSESLRGLDCASPEAAEDACAFEPGTLPGVPLRRALTGADEDAPKLKLVVLDGEAEGLEVPVLGRMVAGSHPSAHLVLEDESVSGQHAEFFVNAGRLLVRDLGSRNGTRVGWKQVLEAEVPCGSIVTLGNVRLALRPRLHLRELPPSRRRRFGELAGRSLRMREAFAALEHAAGSDVTVLFEGESGTGKSLAARELHRASARASGTYVVVDCASLPQKLAEDELFGQPPPGGALHRAAGGSLFLDEVGALPHELQGRLLRVLEAAGAGAKPLDVRVIASTRCDLGAEVRRGNFRADLLDRLEAVKLRLPPLRERLEDLPALVARLSRGRLAPDGAVDGENLARLVAHSWPGNVRELRALLERAFSAAGKKSGLAFSELVFDLDAPEAVSQARPASSGVSEAVPFKEAKERLVRDFETAYLEALLARHQGNLTRAAAAAGISRKHIYALLRRDR